MASKQVTARFRLEKLTKGAVRYQEINDAGEPVQISDGAKIGTLYLRKSALDGDEPQVISAVISYPDN